jgi:hypothetical protein
MLQAGKICPSDVGLYDNGGTLPILLLMMNKALDRESVYDVNKSVLDGVYKDLVDLTRPKRSRGFRLYSRAKDLANDLGSGQIKLVLGGGAWLEPYKSIDSRTIDCIPPRFHLPETDGGFLWVEGAAVTRNAESLTEALVEFLSSQVLELKYQLSLDKRIPYGSSPVTTEAIRFIRKSKALQTPIQRDTRAIYPTPSTLNPLLLHRRCPTHTEDWLDTWNRIAKDCCKRMYDAHSHESI